MTSIRSSSEILKAAHKLDKYLMNGDKSNSSKQQTRKPTSKDADDIDDPLSMPRVGESSSSLSGDDDDCVITNATSRHSNNDTLSKFAKYKRKPPSSSSLMAKKPKITTDSLGDDEIESEETKKVTSKENKLKPTTQPKQPPKKISAVAMLADDDDDDDVLNFSALEGICAPTKGKSTSTELTSKSSETKLKPASTKSPSTTSTTSSTLKKENSLSSKNKIVPILNVEDDFIDSDSEGKRTPKKKNRSSNKGGGGGVDIISLIKGTSTSSSSTSSNKSNHLISEDKKPAPRTPLTSKFTKPKTPAEAVGNPDAGLWVEKYEPTNEQELAVQPKKIAEVRKWIRNSLDSLQNNTKYAPRMLILTGPCGSGKTALLRVLAKEVNCEICEWITPPLATKKDSKDSLTLPYMPRLLEFQKWLRFAGLSQGLFASSNKILLIEDLPFLADIGKTDEFRQIIREFLRATQYPLIFILSDTFMGNSAVNTILSHDILESPLVNHIGVNAVTAPKAKKGLERIVRGENLNVDSEQIESIIHDNEGDIRAIINSMQFFCIGQAPKEKPKAKGKSKTKEKQEKQEKKKEKRADKPFLGCRDISLSLFHALGKILYNKRLPESNPDANIESPHYRPPMENVPEQVIDRVHVEPSMFNMFLHQNYVDFFSDVDDISNALLYLSDADRLAKPWEDSATFGPFVASVAARGFQYSQAHEFERKFLPLKKPQLIENMRTRESNSQAVHEMVKREIYEYHASLPRGDDEAPQICIAPTNTLFTEILPFMHQILSTSTPTFRDSAVMAKFYPAKNNSTNNNNFNNNNYNNNNNSYRNNNNNNNTNTSNNNLQNNNKFTNLFNQPPPTTKADYESFLSGPSYNLLTSLCTYSSNPGNVWDGASRLETWFIPEDENAQQEEKEKEKLSDDIEEF